MSTNIAAWGSSLAIRLPKREAEQAGFTQGVLVDVCVEKHRLVVKKAKPRYSLNELVTKITPENLHAETDTGPAVGNEYW